MKIKTTRKIKLEEPIAVYDLSVVANENFILENGIVVHNSKDVSDCIASVVHRFSMLRATYRGQGRQSNSDRRPEGKQNRPKGSTEERRKDSTRRVRAGGILI